MEVRTPSRIADASSQTPAKAHSHAATWKRPSQSVFASRPATVVAGWSPVDVSMWCHWRIWCSTIPSTKPPKPMPSRIPAIMARRSATGEAVCTRNYRLRGWRGW